jgi:hypothetical protein
MGVLPQALEIIFQVQRKRSNEKYNKKKKKLFTLQNTFLFHFSSLETAPILKFITFLFFIHLK